MTFGQWLKEKRKEKNWTLAEVAQALGCVPSYVHDIENGRRQVTIEGAQILARKVGFKFSRIQLMRQFPTKTEVRMS